MRLRVHIKEGVERGQCGTCNSAHLATDVDGHQRVLCQAVYMGAYEVRKPVVECSSYESKFAMTRHDMEQKAWVLEVKKGQVIGFVNPVEWAKRPENND